MVKKLQKMSADKKNGPQFSNAVKDSAQQIWLAGLGAFAKAQAEGGKVFDTLVKEGQSIQRKTQAVAEEKISEASIRMSEMASDIQAKAGNRWDKLETIFEDRVAKALAKLGVPAAKEVSALASRLEELEKTQRTASRSASKPAAKAARPATAAPAAGAATRKPAAKAALKTGSTSGVKAGVKTAAKPAAKSVAQPTSKPVTKSASKPAAKSAVKSAVNPANKPATKSAAKPATKATTTIAKKASRPSAKRAAPVVASPATPAPASQN